MNSTQHRTRRPLQVVSALVFAPMLTAIGLMTLPANVQSTFVHTPTTSARYRLDSIAYHARPQAKLDYSGYHHGKQAPVRPA